jgi:hypothetical protein
MIPVALLATALGAICMALMIVTDRLMVGDCYQGKPNQAWFVSSLAGSLFGLMLTFLIWIGLAYTGNVEGISYLMSYALSLFIWKGLAAMVVGVIGVQMLLHYFRCFGERAHSAAIAAWLASTPIFVFVGMLILGSFVAIDGMSATSTEPLWVIGVLLATTGLVGFERLTGGPGGRVGTYKKELIKLIAFNVLYAILLRQTFSIDQGNDGLLEATALMPYYWIGFAAGMRVMLRGGEWATFRSNWRKRIRYFIVPILFVEVIGMLVFFFEYVGLTSLDPTLVTVIMGTHVLLVYALDLSLGRLRHWMEERKIHHMYIGGIRLLAHKLPEPKFNSKIVFLETCLILMATVGVTLVI